MRVQLKSPDRPQLAGPLSLAALLLFLLPLALFAQPPGRGGGPMGPGGGAAGDNLLQMLESPAARALSLADSLGLNADQRDALSGMERVWTETHGERIASLRTQIDAMVAPQGQPRDRDAMRARMQGGQAPLQGLMQEMAPLREDREAMLRDMADVLTAAQFQQLRTRLMPQQRPGANRQQAQAAPSRPTVRGWINRTDARLLRLEVQGERMQRQLRQRRSIGEPTGA